MPLQNIQLVDSESGSTAQVLAGFGFNCHQFRVVHQGRPLDVLWSEADFAGGGKRASGSGVPLLFPFPGRLRGTRLEWGGRRYDLREGDGRGNAIHGFVHERPWRVVQQEDRRVTGQFQASVDDPDLLKCWPADFRITVTYQLAGSSLKADFLVENPGRDPLPCGLGAHPYFRTPLGGASADDCVVRLPVTEQWELREMLVTGRRTPLGGDPQYPAGVRLGDMSLDNVFTGLQFKGDRCEAGIRDPESGRTMTLTFDRAFRECVVYNPPHRHAVCIEPYTCAPDSLWLDQQGIDGGLRVLAPGESLRAVMEIRCD